MLEGDLWLRGSGDPQLVIEDLWLLVQRLRGAGVREIRGNLMLDRSAFEAAQHDPGAFDGEALRPYNAGPDALLLNYKAVSFHFIADQENKQARVYALPALAGMVTPATVRGRRWAMQRLARAARRRLHRSAAADVSRRVSAVVRRQGLACQRARHRSICRGDISLAVGFERRRMARTSTRGLVCRPMPGGSLSMSLEAAGRSDPRHQQVQQQRDGAAIVSDAGQRSEPQAREQGARAARSGRLARR